ncbi:MAG: hypothetical protein IK065_05130 [Neisseriaceae bacterium]|nr:hypothetical protein [Neisseriaceae bacterium]
MFVNKIAQSLQTLKNNTDIIEIANILENCIEQITSFNVERNLHLQAAKRKILGEFIYQAADIVRSKKTTFKIPDNRRRLNVDICKTFINEVYLKQQLLGYGFKTLSNYQLIEYPQTILNDFLHKEHKIRKLHIVRTSKYIFAVAPSIENINIYMIRRFLEEKRLFSADSWVLKGCAIELKHLSPNEDLENPNSLENQIRSHVDHILSVESTISPLLIEFFNDLEKEHQEVLLPLLFEKPLNSEKSLHDAIIEKIEAYESLLTEFILIPLRDGLRKLLLNKDEVEYSYIATQQLFNQFVTVLQDFSSLPAIENNNQVRVLSNRLLAYAMFVSKRHQDVFIINNSEANGKWNECNEKSQAPLNKVKEIIKDNYPKYHKLEKEVNAIKEKLEAPESFFSKLFKRRKHLEDILYEKQKQANRARWNVHNEIFNLTDEFKNEIVDLEFDTMTVTDENRRNYAFPDGDNGLTKLPIVIGFANSISDFDLTGLTQRFVPELIYKLSREDD